MLFSIQLVLWIVAISFPVTQTLDLSCDENDICQGEGPLNERPCCGGLEGTKCIPGHADCNKLLGYECSSLEYGTGFCTGHFGMTITNISITSISLSWDDFKPPGYSFEYSILYSTVYSNDTKRWTREEHGDMSLVTVYGLQPNTLYFIRVATWQQLDVIANLTETVVISTAVLPYCYYNNKKFRVGQEFQIDCEDVCVCMTDGELECRPVCNDTSLLLPTAPNLVCREEMSGCCPTTVCDEKSLLTKPVGTSIIQLEDQTCSKYSDRGIRTWHRDCLSYCNCTGSDVICYPLCTTSPEPVLSGSDCRLVNQPYLCCYPWICQPDNVHTVTLNVTLELDGRCEESDPVLLSLLSEAGASLMYFYSLREYSVPRADGVSCTIDRTYIQCGQEKSLDKIHLMLSVSLHVRITHHDITLDDLVAMMYNTTGSMTSAALYDGNMTFPVVAVHITKPIYTCCKGFSWNGFQCVDPSESSSRLFQIYEVLDRSVVLNWSLSLYDEDVTSIVVCWKQLGKETQVTQIPVNKSRTKVHITDLQPSTMYTAWLDVFVQNATWVHFQEIHFLTTTESLMDTRTYQNYLVGVIVAMVTVTVGVLVGGSILLIRKRWQTHKEHIPHQNAFENKIFEIRIREDGIF